MSRQRAGAAHRVVQSEPGRDVSALPAIPRQWIEEGNGTHEMGSEPGEHEVAFLERLADQGEVHQLEVAQPAVKKLARARGSAAGDVAGLDERRRQSASRGIKRNPGAGHPATDDEDVE
jgi:hypothetical protein